VVIRTSGVGFLERARRKSLPSMCRLPGKCWMVFRPPDVLRLDRVRWTFSPGGSATCSLWYIPASTDPHPRPPHPPVSARTGGLFRSTRPLGIPVVSKEVLSQRRPTRAITKSLWMAWST
jgi:hypothetical protein